MTSNMEQRKKVCTLEPYFTLLTMCGFQKSGGVKHSNPVYLFYEVVLQNASGQLGDPGDKDYHYCHGNHKILTVTKLMKSNLNGSCIFSSMKQSYSLTFIRTYWSPEAFPNNVLALLCTQGLC